MMKTDKTEWRTRRERAIRLIDEWLEDSKPEPDFGLDEIEPIRLGRPMTNKKEIRLMTIDDILVSLKHRGFYSGADIYTFLTQVMAVQEELGEIARLLRRFRQGVDELDTERLCIEAADVVIAAVCLLGAAAGEDSSEIVRQKLRKDEQRGWRHNGN